MSAIVCATGEGEDLGGTPPNVIKVDRDELGIFESGFAPGEGTIPHTHRKQADAFYVLKGVLDVEKRWNAVERRTRSPHDEHRTIGPGLMRASVPDSRAG